MSTPQKRRIQALLEATLDANGIVARGSRLPRLPQVPAPAAAVAVTLGVRPEQITLARSQEAWCAPGRAESILPMGSIALVQVRLGSAGDGETVTVRHDRRWDVRCDGECLSLATCPYGGARTFRMVERSL